MRGLPIVLALALAACASGHRHHPYIVNFIPFGAGQAENGEPGKALAFAAAETATGAVSFATWSYLVGTYHDRMVPAGDAGSVRTLQQVEIATGFAFFALVAWGAIDAVLHDRPRSEW